MINSSPKHNAKNCVTMPEVQRIKMAFFFDFGEYLPPVTSISENYFSNSLQLWQQEYAFGGWTQKQFTEKGDSIMSIYEAGYQLHRLFWQGTISSGYKDIIKHDFSYNPQIQHIRSSNIDGSRGLRNIHHNLSLSCPTIDIEKATTSNSTTSKIFINQGIAPK